VAAEQSATAPHHLDSVIIIVHDAGMADRYTIISSDCHAGANHATYRE
jgi:hypothetical protein